MSRSICRSDICAKWSLTALRPARHIRARPIPTHPRCSIWTGQTNRGCVHPQTMKRLRFLLTMLAERGEKETFRFLRGVVLKGEPFAEEQPTP